MQNKIYFPVNIAARWFRFSSLIFVQFICLLQNIPVNAQFKLLQFELRANLSDIYIRDECVRGTVEIA